MRPGWQRVVLLIAAAWNLGGGALALLDPAQQFEQLFNGALVMSDPIQLFFYRCTWINVMAWGLAYLIAAFTGSRVAVLLAGGIGKLLYFVACLSLFFVGAGTVALLGAGVVDLLLALLFLVAAFSRRAAASVAATPQPAPAPGMGPSSTP